MTFQEKVLSMTIQEIILNMVESLRNPVIKIKMNSYGCYLQEYSEDGEDIKGFSCYGCAATNTICHIAGIIFNKDTILNTDTRADHVEASIKFVDYFESAIDKLRKGNLEEYNCYASYINMAKVPSTDEFYNLPTLNDDYTELELQKYVDYANTLN